MLMLGGHLQDLLLQQASRHVQLVSQVQTWKGLKWKTELSRRLQVAPAAGVVISICLFCSPIPGAIQARKDNSIGVRPQRNASLMQLIP